MLKIIYAFLCKNFKKDLEIYACIVNLVYEKKFNKFLKWL